MRGEDWSLEDDDRVAELPSYVRSHRIDRIIVAMSDRKGRLPVEQLLAVKSRGVLVQDATEVYEAITGKVPLESFAWAGFFSRRVFPIFVSS